MNALFCKFSATRLPWALIVDCARMVKAYAIFWDTVCCIFANIVRFWWQSSSTHNSTLYCIGLLPCDFYCGLHCLTYMLKGALIFDLDLCKFSTFEIYVFGFIFSNRLATGQEYLLQAKAAVGYYFIFPIKYFQVCYFSKFFLVE